MDVNWNIISSRNIINIMSVDQQTYIASHDPFLLVQYKKHLHDTNKTSNLSNFKDYVTRVAPINFRENANVPKYCTLHLQPCRSRTLEQSHVDGGPICPVGNAFPVTVNIEDPKWFEETCSSLELDDIQTIDGKSIISANRMLLCQMCNEYSDDMVFFAIPKSHLNKMMNNQRKTWGGGSGETKKKSYDGTTATTQSQCNEKKTPKKCYEAKDNSCIPKHYHGKNTENIQNYLDAVRLTICENLSSCVFNSLFYIDMKNMPRMNEDNFHSLFVKKGYAKYFGQLLETDILNNKKLLSEYSVESFDEFIMKYAHVGKTDSANMTKQIKNLIYGSVCAPVIYIMTCCMSGVFSDIANGCIYLDCIGKPHNGVIYEIQRKYALIFDTVLINQFKYIRIMVEKMVNAYGSGGICRMACKMSCEQISKHYLFLDQCIESSVATKDCPNGTLDPLAYANQMQHKHMPLDAMHNARLKQFIQCLRNTTRPYYFKWFHAKRFMLEQKHLNEINLDNCKIDTTPTDTRLIKYNRDNYAKIIYGLGTSLMFNGNAMMQCSMESCFTHVRAILGIYFSLLYGKGSTNVLAKPYQSFKCSSVHERPDLKIHIFIISRRLVDLCKKIKLCEEDDSSADDVFRILNYMEGAQIYCPVECIEGTPVDPSRFDVTEFGSDIRVILNKSYWLNPISGKYGATDCNGQILEIGYLSEYRYSGALSHEDGSCNMSWTKRCHFLIQE